MGNSRARTAPHSQGGPQEKSLDHLTLAHLLAPQPGPGGMCRGEPGPDGPGWGGGSLGAGALRRASGQRACGRGDGGPLGGPAAAQPWLRGPWCPRAPPRLAVAPWPRGNGARLPTRTGWAGGVGASESAVGAGGGQLAGRQGAHADGRGPRTVGEGNGRRGRGWVARTGHGVVRASAGGLSRAREP
jgi:hypothetical protein